MLQAMRLSYIYGLFLLLVGIILILISINWDTPDKPSEIRHILFSLIQTLGVTTFGLGILNIVVETADWRRYFEQRIRAIVIDQSYLQRLDSDILQAMQTNILKALFRDANIDREGSFLNYFHENLHRYIAEPFREDVTNELICEAHDPNSWKVFDRVTYVCRKSAGSIQSDVRWIPDRDEFLSVQSVSIEIQYPYNHRDKGLEKYWLK